MNFRFNLRKKLIAYSFGIAGASSMSVIAFNHWKNREEALEVTKRTSQTLVHTVAANLVDPVYKLMVDEMYRQLQAVKAVPGIQAAQVLDPSGKVLVDADAAFVFQARIAIDQDMVEEARQKRSTVIRVLDDTLVALHPVYTADGEILGFAHIRASLSEARQASEEDLKRSALVSGLMFLLAGTLAYFLSLRFSKPVESLVGAIQQVRDGNLDTHLDLRRNDELGVLAGNLNEMVVSLKTMTSDLQRQKIAAEAAAIAKSRFLANMSHEIRTPLNGVMGMTELLLAGDIPDERQRGYAMSIMRSSESLLSIINNVLDFSKFEAGKLELESIDFLPGDLIADVIELIEQQAIEKGVLLYTSFSPHLREVFRGDPGRLRQTLVNLASNAIKFTNRGRVELCVELPDAPHENPMIRFEVRDTGIGIEAEILNRLFQPFEQGDLSTTKRYGGTGLGLAISKQLIEGMGGRIGVDSRHNSGSVFWFEIPLVRAAIASAQDPLSARTALIINQEGHARKTLTSHLCVLGAEYAWVEDVPTAMKMKPAGWGGTRPEFVFLDRQACGPNIAQDLADLRQSNPGARIFITGLEPDQVRDLGHGQPDGVFMPQHPLRLAELRQLLAEPRKESPAIPGPGTSLNQNEARKKNELLGLRVLLAEDNITNRLLAEAVLKSFGCQVLSAHDGEEAIALWEEPQFDLLLLDWQMPGKDGYDVLAHVRKHETRHTPAIVVTANATANDREACLAFGFDAYIPKPFKREDLLAAIRSVLPPHMDPLR